MPLGRPNWVQIWSNLPSWSNFWMRLLSAVADIEMALAGPSPGMRHFELAATDAVLRPIA